MTPSNGPRNAWQVVTRPTSSDHLDNRVGGVWHEDNGGYAAAFSLLQETLGPPDNHYEGAVLAAPVLYRRDGA